MELIIEAIRDGMSPDAMYTIEQCHAMAQAAMSSTVSRSDVCNALARLVYREAIYSAPSGRYGLLKH